MSAAAAEGRIALLRLPEAVERRSYGYPAFLGAECEGPTRRAPPIQAAQPAP